MFGFVMMIILLFPLISFISAVIAGLQTRKVVRKDDGAPEGLRAWKNPGEA